MRATDLRQTAYGVASVVGLAGTWYFNLTYSGEASYVAAWFANAASSSAAVDLLVAFVAGSIFMLTEGRRLGMRAPWLYVVFGVVLAFAFTFPLFLLMRERALHGGGPSAGRPDRGVGVASAPPDGASRR